MSVTSVTLRSEWTDGRIDDLHEQVQHLGHLGREVGELSVHVHTLRRDMHDAVEGLRVEIGAGFNGVAEQLHQRDERERKRLEARRRRRRRIAWLAAKLIGTAATIATLFAALATLKVI